MTLRKGSPNGKGQVKKAGRGEAGAAEREAVSRLSKTSKKGLTGLPKKPAKNGGHHGGMEDSENAAGEESVRRAKLRSESRSETNSDGENGSRAGLNEPERENSGTQTWMSTRRRQGTAPMKSGREVTKTARREKEMREWETARGRLSEGFEAGAGAEVSLNAEKRVGEFQRHVQDAIIMFDSFLSFKCLEESVFYGDGAEHLARLLQMYSASQSLHTPPGFQSDDSALSTTSAEETSSDAGLDSTDAADGAESDSNQTVERGVRRKSQKPLSLQTIEFVCDLQCLAVLIKRARARHDASVFIHLLSLSTDLDEPRDAENVPPPQRAASASGEQSRTMTRKHMSLRSLASVCGLEALIDAGASENSDLHPLHTMKNAENAEEKKDGGGSEGPRLDLEILAAVVLWLRLRLFRAEVRRLLPSIFPSTSVLSLVDAVALFSQNATKVVVKIAEEAVGCSTFRPDALYAAVSQSDGPQARNIGSITPQPDFPPFDLDWNPHSFGSALQKESDRRAERRFFSTALRLAQLPDFVLEQNTWHTLETANDMTDLAPPPPPANVLFTTFLESTGHFWLLSVVRAVAAQRTPFETTTHSLQISEDSMIEESVKDTSSIVLESLTDAMPFSLAEAAIPINAGPSRMRSTPWEGGHSLRGGALGDKGSGDKGSGLRLLPDAEGIMACGRRQSRAQIELAALLRQAAKDLMREGDRREEAALYAFLGGEFLDLEDESFEPPEETWEAALLRAFASVLRSSGSTSTESGLIEEVEVGSRNKRSEVSFDGLYKPASPVKSLAAFVKSCCGRQTQSGCDSGSDATHSAALEADRRSEGLMADCRHIIQLLASSRTDKHEIASLQILSCFLRLDECDARADLSESVTSDLCNLLPLNSAILAPPNCNALGANAMVSAMESRSVILSPVSSNSLVLDITEPTDGSSSAPMKVMIANSVAHVLAYDLLIRCIKAEVDGRFLKRSLTAKAGVDEDDCDGDGGDPLDDRDEHKVGKGKGQKATKRKAAAKDETMGGKRVGEGVAEGVAEGVGDGMGEGMGEIKDEYEDEDEAFDAAEYECAAASYIFHVVETARLLKQQRLRLVSHIPKARTVRADECLAMTERFFRSLGVLNTFRSLESGELIESSLQELLPELVDCAAQDLILRSNDQKRRWLELPSPTPLYITPSTPWAPPPSTPWASPPSTGCMALDLISSCPKPLRLPLLGQLVQKAFVRHLQLSRDLLDERGATEGSEESRGSWRGGASNESMRGAGNATGSKTARGRRDRESKDLPAHDVVLHAQASLLVLVRLLAQAGAVIAQLMEQSTVGEEEEGVDGEESVVLQVRRAQVLEALSLPANSTKPVERDGDKACKADEKGEEQGNEKGNEKGNGGERSGEGSVDRDKKSLICMQADIRRLEQLLGLSNACLLMADFMDSLYFSHIRRVTEVAPPHGRGAAVPIPANAAQNIWGASIRWRPSRNSDPSSDLEGDSWGDSREDSRTDSYGEYRGRRSAAQSASRSVSRSVSRARDQARTPTSARRLPGPHSSLSLANASICRDLGSEAGSEFSSEGAPEAREGRVSGRGTAQRESGTARRHREGAEVEVTLVVWETEIADTKVLRQVRDDFPLTLSVTAQEVAEAVTLSVLLQTLVNALSQSGALCHTNAHASQNEGRRLAVKNGKGMGKEGREEGRKTRKGRDATAASSEQKERTTAKLTGDLQWWLVDAKQCRRQELTALPSTQAALTDWISGLKGGDFIAVTSSSSNTFFVPTAPFQQLNDVLTRAQLVRMLARFGLHVCSGELEGARRDGQILRRLCNAAMPLNNHKPAPSSTTASAPTTTIGSLFPLPPPSTLTSGSVESSIDSSSLMFSSLDAFLSSDELREAALLWNYGLRSDCESLFLKFQRILAAEPASFTEEVTEEPGSRLGSRRRASLQSIDGEDEDDRSLTGSGFGGVAGRRGGAQARAATGREATALCAKIRDAVLAEN